MGRSLGLALPTLLLGGSAADSPQATVAAASKEPAGELMSLPRDRASSWEQLQSEPPSGQVKFGHVGLPSMEAMRLIAFP